ncbi:hypothetical protein BVC80_1777g18 [Macleaya cordata]|uniref:Retrotransposon Copia-like N-terminal domain-containing protein n=1 Tax=Macleaya cordata TaxID=56857 RepID=A0A200QP05_MACCD|nr:hypothetical protein BVC80_1777g18 [Macleaya cordata]
MVSRPSTILDVSALMAESTTGSVTSTTSTSPSPSSTPAHPTSINHIVSVKLETSNYLLWLAQFKPLLKGYNLVGYVDGTFPCPPRYLGSDDTTVNPACLAWEQQDQVLLGWLLSSLSDPVLARMLNRELQHVQKGSKTMAQYFLHAKSLADSLSAAGHVLTDAEVQAAILQGLEPAYDAVVTTLTGPASADLSMDDFYAHLQAFEIRLDSQNEALRQQPVANVATQNRSNGPPRFSTHGTSQGNIRNNFNPVLKVLVIYVGAGTILFRLVGFDLSVIFHLLTPHRNLNNPNNTLRLIW